jgi:hypothetical protein
VKAVRTDSRGDVGEIQPPGEVVAVGEDKSGSQFGIAFKLTIGESEFLKQREIGGVALVRPVEADEQNVPIPLDGNPGGDFWSGGGQRWPFENWLVWQCYCADTLEPSTFPGTVLFVTGALGEGSSLHGEEVSEDAKLTPARAPDRPTDLFRATTFRF